jgi:hypothetical protein
MDSLHTLFNWPGMLRIELLPTLWKRTLYNIQECDGLEGVICGILE